MATEYWIMPTDPRAESMVMSPLHPYWPAAEAIHRRAGHAKILRIRCGHRQMRSHAVRATERWDAATRQMLADWEVANADLMRAPLIERMECNGN